MGSKDDMLSRHVTYCIQLWIRPVLFSPYKDLRLIRPVLNSPTYQFCYIILTIELNWPSFKFALEPEGEKGENKTGAKFSLYTVHAYTVMIR